jgi:hypothetical protein
MQWATPIAASNLGFGLSCLGSSGIRCHRDESVESRIELFDACQAIFRQLDG